jgi:hypothetical protein
MKGWKRSLTTLVGAAAAGALIWFVPHYDRWATGGYWAGMATFALAGIVLGVAQLRGREGNPTTLFLIVFLPVLVVAGWVMLATQPRSGWIRDHVLSWSGDIGLGHVVHNLGEHVAVLAFGTGLVFGLTFELAMVRRQKVAVLPFTVGATKQVAVVEPSGAEPSVPADPILVETQAMPVVEPAVPDEPTVVETQAMPVVEPAAQDVPTAAETQAMPVVEPTAAEEPTVVGSPEPGDPEATRSKETGEETVVN